VSFVPDDRSSYEPSSRTVHLDVTKAPLTVTVKDATRSYGDVNPDFAVAYGGFRAGDSAASLGGSLQFATLAGPASPVGAYAVAASGLSSADYAIAFVDGTVKVVRSKVVVTASDVSLDRSDKARKITFTATVTNATTGAPVSGVPVTFTVTRKNGTTLECTDESGPAGVATCRTGAVKSSAFPRQSSIAVVSAATRNLAAGTETARLTVR
jgi:hypothetical protein